MGLHRSNFPSTPEKMRLSKTNWPTYASELKELCESRGGRPVLPVPNSSYGVCGCIATLNLNQRPQELCKSGSGCRELPVANSSYGLCGCKAAFEGELVSCLVLWAQSTTLEEELNAEDRVK